jgi:hypothetical protein
MIDEKSRYSRYTTEHDEINLEKFDEDLEETNDVDDKYGGNGPSYPITAVLSDESNPATWHSDEEDEKKSKTMRSQEKGDYTNSLSDLGFESPRRNGGRKKKYQDLQSFQKKRSSSSKASSGIEQKNDHSFQFPGIGALLSPTKQPGTAPETISRIRSDTSSLTDPLHKLEKHTVHSAKQRNRLKSSGKSGLPSEILAARSQKQRSEMVIPVTSSESSDNLHHRYKSEDEVVSLTAEEKLVELDRHMARISASESGSISFLGEQEMLRDRYAELEAASSRSSDKRKKKSQSSGGNKDTMYTKSLMMEEESLNTNDSPRPLGRVERTKRGQMKELDEYSLTMSVQDTPALVQCLKFYHCGAAAALAGVATGGWFSTQDNVAKEVELLGRGPELSEVDKLRYRDNEDDILSSKPVVRVRSVSSKASKARSAGTKQPSKFDLEQEYEIDSMVEDEEDDSKFDEATVDAPDIAAVDPNSNRYLREVTALSLRLDDGDDQQRCRPTTERGRKMAHESDDGIKIREISIPRSFSSTKSRKEKKQKKDSAVLHETQNQSNQRALLDAQNTIRDVEDSKRDESTQPKQMSLVQPTNMDLDENTESPEMDIVNKKSSGGNSEKLKKGFSGVFSRFGRRGKKANV